MISEVYPTKTSFRFNSIMPIEITDLITFSEQYTAWHQKLIAYLKEKEGLYISLYFTRILKDGTLKQFQEVAGKPVKITESSFTFLSARNISGDFLTDDEVQNHIRFDNVLGVIPVDELCLYDIFQKRNSKISKEYFLFLEEIKEAMEKLVGHVHYVELFFKEFTVEAEILEVNASNLLIKQKRRYSNEKTPDGKFLFLDLIPQEKNILFIEQEDFLQGIEIHNFYLNINPHDED